MDSLDTLREGSHPILPPTQGLFYTDEPILSDQITDAQTYPILRGGMWRPQSEWWELDNFVRIYVGGYGSGKSVTGSKRIIALALQNAPVPVAAVAPTFPMAATTIIPTIQQLLDSLKDWHRYWYDRDLFQKVGRAPALLDWEQTKGSPHEFRITYEQKGRKPIKGLVYVYSGEHPERLKGPNLGAAWLDEAFIQDLSVFEQMAVRCRHPKAKRREVNITGCVDRRTRVWTEEGFVPISRYDNGVEPKERGEIDVDVLGVGDKFHKATHFYNNGVDEVVDFLISTGQRIRCTPDHPVLTLNSDNRPEWKRVYSRKRKYAHLRQVEEGDHVAVSLGAEIWGSEDPVEEKFGVDMTENDAMTLGYLTCLGTGQGWWRARGDEAEEHIMAHGICGHQFVMEDGKILAEDEEMLAFLRSVDLDTAYTAPSRRMPEFVGLLPRDLVMAYLAARLYYARLYIRTAAGPDKPGVPSLKIAFRSVYEAQDIQSMLLNAGIVCKMYVESGRINLTMENAGLAKFVDNIEIGCEHIRNDLLTLVAEMPVRAPRNDRVPGLMQWMRAVTPDTDVEYPAPYWLEGDFKAKVMRSRAKTGLYPEAEHLIECIRELEPEHYTEAVRELEQFVEQGYYWAKFNRVFEKDPTETVDFYIPDTHSVVSSGGFVYLQTPEQLGWGADLAEGDLRDKYDVGLVVGSTLENKALPRDYIESLLKSFDPKVAEAYLHGKFVNLAKGMVYYAFDRDANVREIQMPQGAKLFAGMDFNVNPFCAVIGWYTRDHIHYIDEIELENSDTQEMAHLLMSTYGRPGAILPMCRKTDTDIALTTAPLREVFPDSNAGRSTNSPGGRTDYDWLKESGFVVRKNPRGNPPLRDRWNAVNALLAEGPEGVRMTVDPRCTKLIRYMSQYAHEFKHRDSQKALSHLLDARDYPACYLFPATRPSASMASVDGF